MNTFTDMAGIVPEGTQGVARIEHYTVSKEDSDFTRIRATMHPDEYVPAGNYCRLYVGSALMMSDTRMERSSNYGVVHNARGDVLIAGLGVGLILVPILAKKEVRSVTVVEKYRDVIDLVEPAIKKVRGAKKLAVVEASIFTWEAPKGKKWDCIYFDIWPTICGDNLKEMETLHRKFAKRKTPGAWMHSWQKDQLKYHEGRERRMAW